LQVGEGPPALQEDASTVPGHETRGKVVELREIRPRAFFWETLREIAAPGLRSRQK